MSSSSTTDDQWVFNCHWRDCTLSLAYTGQANLMKPYVLEASAPGLLEELQEPGAVKLESGDLKV